MSGEKYYRIYNGLTKQAWMMPENEIEKNFIGERKSLFKSTGYYTKEQYLKFLETGSVAGFETKTNQIWFDFDSKEHPEDALRDVIKLCTRLYKQQFKINQVGRYYSGAKGFHVVLKINQELTVKQVKQIILKFGEGLQTLDLKVYDQARILRISNTKHEKTDLYKIPLLDDDLFDGLEKIKELAKQPRILPYEFQTVDFPQELIKEVEEKPKKENIINVNDPLRIKGIDFSQKPVGWPAFKWSIANGRFEIGTRNHSMMVIASTCRALKYGRSHAEAICLSADKLHCEITGDEPMSETDLEKQILDVVFGENWNGGQYSPETNLELKNYCEKYGFVQEKTTENEIIKIEDVTNSFRDFVKNIDKNTIKTGISCLDKAIPITIGMNLGIIGAASSGKTAIGLDILKSTSLNNVVSVVASLDMHKNRLFEKLLYKVSYDVYGEVIPKNDLYRVFNDNEDAVLVNEVKKQFGNVFFYDRSRPSVDNIRKYILDIEAQTGKKVKLLLIDYFERIGSDNIVDPTASSLKVANELQDLLNDLNLAIVTLVQPNKFSLQGGPDSPILSYTSIKGSSFLYQSFRAIVSIWRPFFTPQTKEMDKFLEMAILKNDLGELDLFKFNWDGSIGSITEMTKQNHDLYNQFVENKKNLLNENKEENAQFGRFRK